MDYETIVDICCDADFCNRMEEKGFIPRHVLTIEQALWISQENE